MPDRDAVVRIVVFSYVDRPCEHGEGPFTWGELTKFTFDGIRVPLVSQQDICKPAMLDLPISIRTTFRKPGQELLRRGLQELDGVTIHLPRSPGDRPKRTALEQRDETFQEFS